MILFVQKVLLDCYIDRQPDLLCSLYDELDQVQIHHYPLVVSSCSNTSQLPQYFSCFKYSSHHFQQILGHNQGRYQGMYIFWKIFFLSLWKIVFFYPDSLNLRINSLNLRFYSLNLRFYSLNVRFYSLNLRINSLNLKFYALNLRFYSLNLRFYSLNLRINSLNLKVYSLNLRFYSLAEFKVLFAEFKVLFAEFKVLFAKFKD